MPDYPTDMLSPISTWDTRLEADVLVIGAGIAGLSFSLSLPESIRTVIVTKGALGESNTWYAQGGLAAAVGPDDDPDLHYADTIAAGAGLCDEGAVRTLVEGGPDAVAWLLDHGTRFDFEHNNALALGKEAAHSRNRVIHAGGDATGAEIERSLVAQLRARATITILDNTTALDLVVNRDGSCAGAIVVANDATDQTFIAASATVLANGGVGQLWAVTSNPPGATGDGIAMAMRAGVTVADLEFTQFHPTVLNAPGIDPFLITEAIRGEGAYLRDINGSRFMLDIHELAELAPRDVVARAIQRQVSLDGGQPVYLDLRHLDPDMIARRFPTIAGRLDSHGISLANDLVPVSPAAHYFMGGIVAGTEGHTSMPGLLAIGEVSCTGVHGANRLASNSLLEGLVFGLRAAAHVAGNPMRTPDTDLAPAPAASAGTGTSIETFRRLRSMVQGIMSAHVAVVRDVDGLRAALAALHELGPEVAVLEPAFATELRNLILMAVEVTHSALVREESRGSHYRSDFPDRLVSLDHCHQRVVMADAGFAREFGALHADVRS